mmetsp:Transcript_36253/g.55695  ORF Transcript_36253/g.55695 Transcript_36253/m.55695 type:complete len:80 (+) Transcript_36253:525-764(+)
MAAMSHRPHKRNEVEVFQSQPLRENSLFFEDKTDYNEVLGIAPVRHLGKSPSDSIDQEIMKMQQIQSGEGPLLSQNSHS